MRKDKHALNIYRMNKPTTSYLLTQQTCGKLMNTENSFPVIDAILSVKIKSNPENHRQQTSKEL